ncbi:MAG: phosphatidate cytidylyltransferase [Dehalococcoidia bacterium]|nr:phosphatidate cytidylyltransferase [Dehalococcoidia bacterium]RLC64185.1 MAG: phosphatidate cytidylyltransferase [Chloroflexota bacterium]
MLKQRVTTAAVGVPLLVFAIWFGIPWFTILIAAAALGGTYEFYRMANFDRREPLLYLGLLWALALVLSPHYLYRSPDVLPVVITATTLISLIWLLCRPSREKTFRNWAWTIAGVLYVGWMLSYWLNLRGLGDGSEYGRNWVYLAMLTTFANDTGAFFIGRARGRHKMAPAISPSKTWEGAIGGLTCAILGAIVTAMILNLISLKLGAPFVFKYWQIVLLGFLVSLFAQLGDLVESLLKRNMGVKESGNLLPGHGGILDRFDSLIFVGAVIYYYVLSINAL